jgi:hypothetical protein
MWAITIEDGKEQRQLFYFSEVKARDRIKELLITQINKLMLEYGENPIFLDVDLDYIPCFDLQSMLSVMIKCKYGEDMYDESKYEVTISKIEFEDN